MKKIPDNAKKVFEGMFFSVWQWEQKMFDGSTKIFEYASRPSVCTILAVTKEKKILLLEEEQPSEEKTFTFPSGVIESNDTRESCAKRELEEETGYTSKNISYWFSKDAGARMDCEYHIFLAKDCELVGDQVLDPEERIKVSLIDFEELLEIIEEIKFKNYSLYPLLLKAKYSPKYRNELSRLLGITPTSP